MEKWNARIESTMLGYEHGRLTFMLNLEFGAYQGFGGYGIEGIYAAIVIANILGVVGVSKWEDLPGKYVVCHGNDSKIEGISNILDKDNSFFLTDLTKAAALCDIEAK